MPTPDERIILYQIFTRLFGNNNTSNVLWGSIEENGVGKLRDITTQALHEIAEMGVTHVWYTGIIEHALLTDYSAFGIPKDHHSVVKGRAGSPYAIKDYYDVNPDLAVSVPDRLQEFDDLVARTHTMGMRVIIDFVPNHLARYYHSDAKPDGVKDFGEGDDTGRDFDPDNNFYYINEPFQVPQEYQVPDVIRDTSVYNEKPARATGNDVFSSRPSIHDWFETVKLNYGVEYSQSGRVNHFSETPDTWKKMRDILLYWSGRQVDGFRCDMAEMVPVEFWEWVIYEVKKQYPDILFIAEIYDPQNYRDYIRRGGFDYLYDKVELYDTLKNIIRGHASTDAITHVWQAQEGIQDHMLRFLENHDEQRIAWHEFAGDMRKGIPMMAASAFMHRGPVMMYFGQEVGEAAIGESGFSGNDGRTTIFDYWSVPEHIKWMNGGAFDGGALSTDQKELRQAYIQILKACNEHPALQYGSFFDLQYFNRNNEYTGYNHLTYAFIRHCEEQALLVLINFSETTQTLQVKIPESALEMAGLTDTHIQIGSVVLASNTLVDYTKPSELVFILEPMTYQLLPMK